MSIVTKGGDRGETSLLYGGRIPKDDLHTQAYGALDEAIAMLGLARAHEKDVARAERLLALQRELFTVGAELATGPGHHKDLAKHFPTVEEAMVKALDSEITDLEARIELPRAFIIPGGTPVAAMLDVARTVIRRAERHAVTLLREKQLDNPEVVRYLNRCSDLLFMLARQAEQGSITVK